MAEPLILAYGRGELPEFPAAARHDRRHRPGRPRRLRDRRGAGAPAGAGRGRLLPRLQRRPQPADLQRPLHARCAPTSTTTRSPPATAARPGCRSGGSPAPGRSSGCCPRARRRGRSPTTWSATRRAATGPATWPASCTSRAAGWSSCAATSTSTWSTPPPSCASPTSRRWRCTRRSPPRTGRRSPSTPRSIDWPHYFIEVHCPAVTAPVRRLDELRALRKKPAAGRTAQRRLAAATGIAAFFDMDGTLLSSNVIETYLWVRLRELDGGERLAELGRIASKVPSLVQAERRSRSDFLRGDLPRVRRRPARRPRRGRRRAPGRPHPVPALARRRTPDPRAPRRRPPRPC